MRILKQPRGGKISCGSKITCVEGGNDGKGGFLRAIGIGNDTGELGHGVLRPFRRRNTPGHCWGGRACGVLGVVGE